MTIQRINFEIVSNLAMVYRRDFPMADQTLVDPTGATCLYDGEFVKLGNNVGHVGQLERATAIATPTDPALTICFPVWAERGRYDIQATPDKLVPILFQGPWEADTRVYDSAVAVAIATVGQPVKVWTITIGSRNYTGLVGSSYDETGPIVGYVTRLPATNGLKLRVMSGWAVRNGTT